MNHLKCLITSLFIFLFLSNISFSQETKQTDFSEYKLTDIISTPDGTLLLSTDSAGIFKSTDDGKTWTLTSKITRNYNVRVMAYNDYLGILAGTSQGKIIQSIDYGKSWRIRPHEYYQGSTSIESITIYKQKYALITYSNGGAVLLFDGIDARLGMTTNQINKIKQFHITENGELYNCGEFLFKNEYIERWRSSWKVINNGMGYFTNCITSNSDTLLVGTNNGAYFASIKDYVWTLFKDLVNFKITTIVQLGYNLIFAGTDSNGVFYSKNNGVNWINIPSEKIKSKIKKFAKCKNSNNLIIVTEFNGLYTFNLKTFSLDSNKYSIDLESDSIYADNWMPFGNIDDIDTKFEETNSQINRIQLLNNDSLIYVSSKDNTKKIFYSSTGKLYKKFQFPDSLKMFRDFTMVSPDSILYTSYSNKQFHFRCYSLETGKSNHFISVDELYFVKFMNIYGGTGFPFIHIISEENQLLYIFDIRGTGPYGVQLSQKGFEIRDLVTGELIRQVKGNVVFSKDMKYYILNDFTLYDFDGNLIYDLKAINSKFKNISGDYSFQTIISPHNKYILLSVWREPDFIHYIIDFKTGKIINEIPYDFYEYNFNFTYDDRFLVTASWRNWVKIYNVLSPEPAFDKLQWTDDSNQWQVSIAKNSNIIYLGSGNENRYYDNKNNTLILWKPDFSLTSVRDEEEFQKPEKHSLIFPNPASEYIEINVETIHELSLREIKIFDVLGNEMHPPRLASQSTPQEGNLKIDISSLPAGVYFVKIGGKVSKFVKI